jgi:molybdenum cofactor cytidylyltransferase
LPPTLTGILLAAGSGSRFGGGKLLAPLAGGTPVGLQSWRNLSAALPDPLVVVRSGDEAAARMFREAGARVAVCADAADGMSRSLIAGIEASPPGNGWVIALGDMPYVLPETIAQVAEAVERGALIAMPARDGAKGHPVGFSARLRPALLDIAGDEGARAVVRRHARDVVVIETPDPGILRDIDTREDLGLERP